jgi:hypothetical protein
MSRPYLKINPTYNSTTDVVSLDIQALRMRGVSSLVFTGLSASQTINLTNGFYNGSTTFSANLDAATTSGDANTLYVNPTCQITFGGTFSVGTSIYLDYFNGSSGYPFFANGSSGYTFSATYSLSAGLDFISGTANTAYVSNIMTGPFTVTARGNNLIFTAPYGKYYSGGPYGVRLQIYNLGQATFSINGSSVGALSGASFSGGSTTYFFDCNTTTFGDFSQSYGLTV